jgi:Spy/CpxP family protein refolding chaperone
MKSSAMKRFVLAMAVTVTVGLAQPPPKGFFAWWDSPIAGDLNLKEEQHQQIREAVRSYRNKLIDQRSAMDKAEGDLEDVFNDEKIDQRKANDAVERLANARAEMSRTVSQMSLKLRSILTADQWHELQRRMPKGPPPPFNRPEQSRPGPGNSDHRPGRDPGPPRGQGQQPPTPADKLDE